MCLCKNCISTDRHLLSHHNKEVQRKTLCGAVNKSLLKQQMCGDIKTL